MKTPMDNMFVTPERRQSAPKAVRQRSRTEWQAEADAPTTAADRLPGKTEDKIRVPHIRPKMCGTRA